MRTLIHKVARYNDIQIVLNYGQIWIEHINSCLTSFDFFHGGSIIQKFLTRNSSIAWNTDIYYTYYKERNSIETTENKEIHEREVIAENTPLLASTARPLWVLFSSIPPLPYRSKETVVKYGFSSPQLIFSRS